MITDNYAFVKDQSSKFLIKAQGPASGRTTKKGRGEGGEILRFLPNNEKKFLRLFQKDLINSKMSQKELTRFKYYCKIRLPNEWCDLSQAGRELQDMPLLLKGLLAFWSILIQRSPF